MIFTGESGLGKSYLALLCHYFFEVLISTKRLTHYFSDHNFDFNTLSPKYQESGSTICIKKESLQGWLAKDALDYLKERLECSSLVGDITVQLPDSVPDNLQYTYRCEKSGLNFSSSDEADSLLSTTIFLSLGNLTLRTQMQGLNDESPYSYLLRYVLIDWIFGKFDKLQNTFLLPPSRGAFLHEKVVPLTSLYDQYLKKLHDLGRIITREENLYPPLNEMFYELLEGEVKMEENKYFYYTKDGVKLPISASASSIRELAPLSLLVAHRKISSMCIFIEEPEAHLHPQKQRMIADVIGGMARLGAFMQITTHSNFFLRRLNELMLYKKVLESDNVEEVEKEELGKKVGISEDMLFDQHDLTTYLLRRAEDNSVLIEAQSLDEGVPFTAFSEAAYQNFNHLEAIERFKD